MTFPPSENSDHVFVSQSIYFGTYSKRDATFYRIVYKFSCANWDDLRDDLKDFPWKGTFKLGASIAVFKFPEWVQVGIDVPIPHRKYQDKTHPSPLFSAACTAAVTHRNYFFRFYQQNKSSVTEGKFRQASNYHKNVTEAAKLSYAKAILLLRK